MLKTQTKNSEVQRIIDKYGEGFDVIYFDGKADGKLMLPEIYLKTDLTRRSSPETPAFHSTKSKTLKESFKTPHLKFSYFIFLTT